MNRLLVLSCTVCVTACGQGSATPGAAIPSASSSPVLAFSPAASRALTPSEVEWARKALHSNDEHGEWKEVLDFIKDAGPAAAPLVGDMLPLLNAHDWVCLGAVRALGAIGPQAASAAPAMAIMVERQYEEEAALDRAARKRGDPAHAVLLCSHDAPGEIRHLGEGAVPYLVNTLPRAELGVRDLLGSLVDQNGAAFLERLRQGGPMAEDVALALAMNESSVNGVREALLASRVSGHVGGRAFLRAVQEFTSNRFYEGTLPLRAFEREVAKLANDPSDPEVQKDALEMLKLFTPCPPGPEKCPPIESLRLKGTPETGV